jgi:hypothetical protein
VEAQLLDRPVLDDDVHPELVTAERVVVVPLQIVRVRAIASTASRASGAASRMALNSATRAASRRS